jgi:hypothetical protein
MNESFMLGLVVACLISAAIVARMTSGEHHARALSRLKPKLDALLQHEGIQFDPGDWRITCTPRSKGLHGSSSAR